VGIGKLYKREDVILAACCLLIALGSLGVAAWFVISGRLSEQGVDGLFLLVVCLSLAASFAFVPMQAIRQGLLRELRGARKAGKTEQPDTSQTTASPSEAELAQKTSQPG
jgi:hypothetical protein